MSATTVEIREADMEAEPRQSYTRRVRRRMDKLTREKNDAIREAEIWQRRAIRAEKDFDRALEIVTKQRDALRARVRKGGASGR
ncbi:MAG TPA: hypothetical protein VK466_07565 [Terriglobales bacterium]|nr:hypothetical protein [Terriglobales bacterium]